MRTLKGCCLDVVFGCVGAAACQQVHAGVWQQNTCDGCIARQAGLVQHLSINLLHMPASVKVCLLDLTWQASHTPTVISAEQKLGAACALGAVE